MLNVGGPEVLVILLVALIAIGPAGLPKAAHQVGQAMSEVRKVSAGFRRELADVMDFDGDAGAKPPSQAPASGPSDDPPEAP